MNIVWQNECYMLICSFNLPFIIVRWVGALFFEGVVALPDSLIDGKLVKGDLTFLLEAF